jgi:hypothetical protein
LTFAKFSLISKGIRFNNIKTNYGREIGYKLAIPHPLELIQSSPFWPTTQP